MISAPPRQDIVTREINSGVLREVWRWFESITAAINSPLINVNTPSSATDYGVKGSIVYDSSYIYVCTDADTWKRSALNTW